MRVRNSQTYRKVDVTREHIRRILELKEILLSFETGFSLVSAAVVCALVYFRAIDCYSVKSDKTVSAELFCHSYACNFRTTDLASQFARLCLLTTGVELT